MDLKVVDIHGHYNFGIDDGAVSLDMSMEMIRKAISEGVTDIVCASHSGFNKERYDEHFDMLNDEIKRCGLDISLHRGCEIASSRWNVRDIVDGLLRGELNPIGKSNYILLEFWPDTLPDEVVECVEYIKNNTKYIPVIAHPERYYNFHNDEDAIYALKGILLQINAYSLKEEPDEDIRTFARRLLKERMVTFLGSDAHRVTHRNVNLKSGIEYIFDTCDYDYAMDICYGNAKRMLV